MNPATIFDIIDFELTSLIHLHNQETQKLETLTLIFDTIHLYWST